MSSAAKRKAAAAATSANGAESQSNDESRIEKEKKPKVNGTQGSVSHSEGGAAAGGGDGEDQVQLKIEGQEFPSVVYKVKFKTILRKVFETYCAKHAVEMNSIKFHRDGKRLQGKVLNKTVGELGFKDGDVIQALTLQIAGTAKS